MAKGIIYVMTTVVPGLIKIGKTQTNQFENRMSNLERNGYSNITGLKRKFAIEVEDYDEKEKMLDDIFVRSRVPNTELFALDTDLAVQLLSSFEGTVVYPRGEEQEAIFDEASAARKISNDKKTTPVPDGIYFMNTRRKGKEVCASMEVRGNQFILKEGSLLAPDDGDSTHELYHRKREGKTDSSGKLLEDICLNSPSMAANVARMAESNGWKLWKTKDGEPIDICRK